MRVAKKATKKKSSSSSTAAKDGKGAFRVAVRCRPLLHHERTQESVLELTKGAVTVMNHADEAAAATADSPRGPSPGRQRERPAGATVKQFSFDHVYDEVRKRDPNPRLRAHSPALSSHAKAHSRSHVRMPLSQW